MATIHKFEAAGLGIAPFRFVRIETHKFCAGPGAPTQAGASCQYCSEPIMECCIICDSRGVEFHVGNVCVEKTGDRGLIDLTKRAVNKMRAEARHSREVERVRATRELLERPEVRAALITQPHPRAFTGVATCDGPVRSEFFGSKTRLDWAEWMMANAGNAGRMEVARYLAEVSHTL